MNLENFFETTMGQNISNMLPGVLGALVVLFVGILIASGIRRLVRALFNRTTLDERLGKSMNSTADVGSFIAKLAYYLVMLFVLLIVLDILGVNNVLTPLQNMLDKFVAFLPNLVGAGIIGYVGYILATIISGATGFLSEKAESFALKQGINTGMDLSGVIKTVVFIIIFIPLLVAAFDTLGIKVIS